MAGCLDHMRFNLEFLNLGERRNIVASIISGTLFFIGWWILIDASAKYPSKLQFNHSYHVCGVIGTFALFMVNSISNQQVLGDSYSSGCMGQRGAKAWLFLGFLLAFAAIISATWILFGAYVIPRNNFF
ncbi:unnamed protein product [Gordionus sp. m RMFG-2023]